VTAIRAADRREFWRARGMHELRLVLWASWDPIGGAPSDEYDRYSFRVASLLASRASEEAIAEKLARIRRDDLDDEPNPAEDARVAGKIVSWFEWVQRAR
jgi:hypothetical protein